MATNRTFHSVVWTSVDRFGAQLFQAIFTIVLARLLMPEDYGLVALIFIFLMVGQMLMDGGLSLALIQKKNPTDEDFSTVFWFNVVFGLFFYGLFFYCAPFIANFYEQPLLIPIIKVAGLNFVIWSFGLVHNTKLTIALNFKKQASISIWAMILSGITGVALAYYGYGVWALVFQFLLNNLLKSASYWLFGPRWKPRFIFKMSSLKPLIAYGSAWILSSLLDTIYKNMFAIFIGKRYALQELGFFQKANSLTHLLTANIAYTISSSFIPLHTKLYDNPDGQRKTFDRFLSLACFIVFPIAILFAILAEPFVLLVLTERWLPIVPFIQIFCFAYLWYPVLVINRSMLLAKGFSKQNLMIDLIVKTFGITAFLIALPHGIAWICVSIGFYAFSDMIVSMIFVKKMLSIRWMEQLKIILPMLGLAIVSGIVAWVATMGVIYYAPTWDLGKLLFGGMAGLGVYLLGSYWLKFDELRFALDYLKGKR